MLKIITGDTAGFTFSLVYPGAVSTTPAPDLTAATIKFIIKKNADDPDYKAVFEQSIVKPDTNIVYFEMLPTDTAKLMAGTYKAGCKVFYDSGLEVTVWTGDISVVKGVFGA